MDNWSQKKHRNNQSDGVMLDECWSTVDCLHVISMAATDLLARTGFTDQLKKTKGGRGRGRKQNEVALRCGLKKLLCRGWRQPIKLLDSRGGFEVAGYSIKTRANVTPFHCILDRCGDLCFVILARACLSAAASFLFPLQLDCLSWGHWTITQSNPLQREKA